MKHTNNWINQTPRANLVNDVIEISGRFEPTGRQLIFCQIIAPYDGENNSTIAEQTRANAKLIEAAPEMLKALRMVLNKVGVPNRMGAHVKYTTPLEWLFVEQAIKKAEGK